MKTFNTFNGGLNQDISKHLVDNKTLVDSFQCIIVNKGGTNFSITVANGNTFKFNLNAGYVAKAAKEYNGLIYIVSINKSAQTIQLGTYQSPNGIPSELGVVSQDFYSPLNNFEVAHSNGQSTFSYSLLSITETLDFIDLELQQDYDDSINMIVVSNAFEPLLINSGFKFRNDTFYSTNRTKYSVIDILAQIKLILDNASSFSIAFLSADAGGSLKPGNYVYYFSYLTQELSEGEIVNQSSICQVSFADGDDLKGGIDTDNAGKRIKLHFSDIDQTFAYIQPYFTYTSGNQSKIKQTVKFNTPIAITSSNMTFTHNGFEQVTSIPSSEIGVDFANIQSASTVAANQGYLFIADISERDRLEESISNWINQIEIRTDIHSGENIDFYKDPKNVHDKLGYFSGETYLIYAVAKYKSGGYSPAFPTQGYDYLNNTSNNKGLVRFPDIWDQNHFANRKINIKHLKVQFPTLTPEIESEIVEIFLVRPERQNSVLLGQGVVLPVTKVPPVSLELEREGTADFYDVDANPGKYVPTIEGQFDVYNGIEDVLSTHVYFATVDGVKRGDMFISMGETYRNTSLQDPKKWALYTSEFLSDSPSAVSKFSQATKISLIGELSSQGLDAHLEFPFDAQAGIPSNVNYASRFEINDISYKIANTTTIDVDSLSYVGENTTATGSDLISTVGIDVNRNDSGSFFRSRIKLAYMPYMGLELHSDLYTSPSVDNPLGYGLRHTIPAKGDNYVGHDSLLGAIRPIGSLINIYNGDELLLTDYYTNADSLAFNQIGSRFKINNLPPSAQDVYGGDCYLAESYYTLNHSPFKDPTELDLGEYRNNDCGLIFSFVAESNNNLNLRHTYFENASDLEETTFYPFNKDYRQKRYSDSNRVSPGYKYDETDVDFFPNPTIIPDVKSSFFTRVFHSAKHIPNSFTNGYRFYTTGFQDYDTSMGKITKLFGYGNNLVIIFEHGVGITPINQRVQTASDTAGAIFIQPSEVLSSQMGIMSYTVGSQHPYSVIKTDHFIYGIDSQQGKIFKIQPDRLVELSEGIIASKIINSTNPRSGYDPINKLVYFSSDEWCYVYSERLDKFITTSKGKALLHAKLPGKGLYGFDGERCYLFEKSNTLYDVDYLPYVEFVINENFSLTKVFDYIDLFSNNQAPQQIEFYTLNFDGSINQKSAVLNEIDYFTGESTIKYRDKKYVCQIPRVTQAEYKDLEWGLNNRLRDKYVIIKVTYADKDFELNLIGTEYRISKS